MAQGNVGNYAGAGSTKVVGANGEVFILVYNGTIGTALTNGRPVLVSYAGTTFPQPVVIPAENAAIAHTIGIVNNTLLGQATIPVGAWGYVQTEGYCPKVAADATVDAAGKFLEVLPATVEAVDAEALGNESFGISKSAVASGYCDAHLFGRPVKIAATPGP
jgi:hypothetical protein